MTDTITLTRKEAQQALDALEHAQATEPIWKTPIREAKETLRARLAKPDPEQTRSEKMREAGYTKRDTRLECDECGKKFTRQMLPVHDCQPEPVSVTDKLPKPEPVAWFTEDHREDKSATTYSKKMAERWKEKGWPVTPLYAAPPQRNWQELTDEEIRNEAKNHVFDESFFSGAVWARGKIMGKNHG